MPRDDPDLVRGMVHIPRKFLMLDVVIADVPPTYGMLLSINWGTSVGGNMKFELYYSTISIFGGDTRCLYRDPNMTYTFSDPKNPSQFPSYNSDYFGNFLLDYESAPISGCSILMYKEVP